LTDTFFKILSRRKSTRSEDDVVYDPPGYLWAIIIAGPTAVAAATCTVLYGGAMRADLGRTRAALLAGGAAVRAAAVRPAHHLCDRSGKGSANTAASHRPAHCRRVIEEKGWRSTAACEAQELTSVRDGGE
jgi:hypothetical protein